MSSNLSTENCKIINYSEFVFVFLSYDILLLPELAMNANMMSFPQLILALSLLTVLIQKTSAIFTGTLTSAR